ncbi:MAG: gamma-glutamyl-gamma-aminobutyrate hydrolase family protein [Gudongella sp.]|jgi:putative glutamine amidotransferase|nr:gamma-glutamyl-gamma-aminobutyrate hydrolase family protein [Gudongella sp.]
MKKPLIGITTQQEIASGKKISRITHPYVEAVVKAGGVPVLIPVLNDDSLSDYYVERLDGLVFSGGEDIWPHYYGEEPMQEVNVINFDRDRSEYAIFKKAYEKGIPILAICRGMQLANVVLGGTLYQDIFKQVPGVGGHVASYNTEEGYHSVELDENSILFEVYEKKNIFVNTEHHQAVKDLGRGLRVTAKAKDGIIEAIESVNDKFLIGVQFHPEAMGQRNEEHIRLYKRLVDEAAK